MTNQINGFSKRDFLQAIGMIDGSAAMITAMGGFDKALASDMTELPKMTADGKGKKIKGLS
jgi:hypothetical protein